MVYFGVDIEVLVLYNSLVCLLHRMSWLPVSRSFLLFLFLVSFFFWRKFGLFIFLIGVFSLLSYFFSEVSFGLKRHPFSFILFMFREALVFITLFFTTLWFEDEKVRPISLWGGLPLEGCYLLIASSLAVTVFHNLYKPVDGYSWWFLVLAIGFGLGFVFLQACEMWHCFCDVVYCAYYASSFRTVGLHFFHVVIGLLILFIVYCKYFGSFGLRYYYVTMSVWYWHFVDYIWLVVFVVVYLL